MADEVSPAVTPEGDAPAPGSPLEAVGEGSPVSGYPPRTHHAADVLPPPLARARRRPRRRATAKQLRRQEVAYLQHLGLAALMQEPPHGVAMMRTAKGRLRQRDRER